MRYERVSDIVRLAVHLQGSYGGLTLTDIQEEFSVSRRTAERMRDAIEAAFGPLDRVDVDSGDRRIHWRLQSRALHPFIAISPEELPTLKSRLRVWIGSALRYAPVISTNWWSSCEPHRAVTLPRSSTPPWKLSWRQRVWR